MYRKVHHQLIGEVLEKLNADLLKSHGCYFGGGTAIALKFGEFRQSNDIDFLVSDDVAYRELRHMVRLNGPRSLFSDMKNLTLPKTFLDDQYGIRGWVEVFGNRIKFEIVSEGRIAFATPTENDRVSGVLTLTETDLIAEKVMANSDRYLDTSTFQRDVIDLAFMEHPTFRDSPGFQKAQQVYGQRGLEDLDKSITKLTHDLQWLDRCLTALDVSTPRAMVVKLLNNLS